MQNKKERKENKKLLEQLHKTQSSAVIDKSKLSTAVKTLSAVKTEKKSNTTEQSSEKSRDIKAFQTILIDKDKLSKLEKRAYMHKDVDSNTAQLYLDDFSKEHRTVYFNKASNKFEALSKDIAKEQIRAHMLANSAVKRVYRTSDFQQLLQSASSSYTDMIRSACRELQTEKFLVMTKIQDTERTRAKYQYELLTK